MSERAERRRDARAAARAGAPAARAPGPGSAPSGPPAGAGAGRGAPAPWLVALALALVVAFAYAPVRDAGFVWDDDDYVEKNELLVEPGGLAEIWDPSSPRNPQYYPLVLTTFRLERALWGLDPTGYHVVNVLLHLVDAFLLYLLLRRVGIGWAWLASLVFAAHPVHVESVAWVAERKNVLSASCYLLAAHAYLSFHASRAAGERGGARWAAYALALACFVLGLFAKTVTASLPVALGLLLWWKDGRVAARTLITLAPMLAIGFAMGMLTRAHEYRHVLSATTVLADLTPVDRLLIAGRAFFFYPWKILVPTELAFIYERWDVQPGDVAQWLFPLAGLALAAALWLLWRKRRLARGTLAATLFYAATIFPALGFVNVAPMRFAFVADHFQYLASIGTILLACAGAWWLARRAAGAAAPRALAVAGIAWVAALAFLAQRQVRVYEDLGTLWADTAHKSPANAMVLNSYANWLRKQRDPDPAAQAALREAAARVTEQALVHARQKEDELLARCNLSSIRLEQQRWPEALELAETALALKPDFAGALSLKGRALYGLGRFDEAEVALAAMLAIAHDPSDGRAAWDVRRRVDDVPVHLILAHIQSQDGRRAEALASYEAVIASAPSHALAQRGRVDELRALQRWAELVRALEAAAASVSDPLPFRHQLAWYLSVVPDAALRDGPRALALARELGGAAPAAHPLTASVYAAALAETGELEQALAVAKDALERARRSGVAELVPQLEAQVADYRAGRATREGSAG